MSKEFIKTLNLNASQKAGKQVELDQALLKKASGQLGEPMDPQLQEEIKKA